MTVGKKIRELRKRAGLTQKELGKLSGTSETTIKQYELEKRQPRMEQLQKVATALDVQVNDLLPWESIPEIRNTVYASDLEMLDIFYENKHFNYSKSEQEKIKQEINNHITIGNTIANLEERQKYYDDLVIKYSHKFLEHILEPYTEQDVIRVALLLAYYFTLNNDGKDKTEGYIEDLTEIPRYTKPDDPPQD